MDVLHSATNAINYLAVHIPWAAVGASGVLSPVLLGVKKWFSVQSEKVMISLVALSSMLVAAGHYLLNVPTHDPTIIAAQGAALAFMTQPFYFFIVKPLAAAVSEQLAKAAAFDAQVKSAVDGPLAPAGPDFSQ
jgi:hypothetical protein